MAASVSLSCNKAILWSFLKLFASLALKKKSATTIYLLTKKNRIKSHILSFENFDLKTPKMN